MKEKTLLGKIDVVDVRNTNLNYLTRLALKNIDDSVQEIINEFKHGERSIFQDMIKSWDFVEVAKENLDLEIITKIIYTKRTYKIINRIVKKDITVLKDLGREYDYDNPKFQLDGSYDTHFNSCLMELERFISNADKPKKFRKMDNIYDYISSLRSIHFCDSCKYELSSYISSEYGTFRYFPCQENKVIPHYHETYETSENLKFYVTPFKRKTKDLEIWVNLEKNNPKALLDIMELKTNGKLYGDGKYPKSYCADCYKNLSEHIKMYPELSKENTVRYLIHPEYNFKVVYKRWLIDYVKELETDIICVNCRNNLLKKLSIIGPANPTEPQE